ncbi:RusA family crossover junction endodeoxyribonuclease [Flavonifractor plautii]|uniref:RusA family crossover junction endodeoxyribonuclease n=1 Tax=Flavonifractor plautii TaxID=292800 RepID=UPI001896F04C|nr:RusA family crossover junction endodeoxyribonuclease [Flavonifractor plautii]
MAEIKYIVKLPPVSKKNSQQILTNRKTGRPFIMPSSKYRQYEREAAWFLKPRPPRPIECEVSVKCLFYMPTRRRVDLNNLLEAATDLLVSAGVLKDDHCGIVVSHDGSRVLYDKESPRTEITITRMPGDWQMALPLE